MIQSSHRFRLVSPLGGLRSSAYTLKMFLKSFKHCKNQEIMEGARHDSIKPPVSFGLAAGWAALLGLHTKNVFKKF